MTNRIRLAVFSAIVGAVGITTAQAAIYNGDLLIGFTAESGNDLVYDLGSVSSVTNGRTWNLNSLLAGFTLATVKWGVIGDNNPGVRTAYCTRAAGSPPRLSGNSAWAALDTPTKAIYTLFPTAGADQGIAPSSTLANSWNQQTIAGTTPNTYKNAYVNPNVTGLTNTSFYRIVADNSDPTLLGKFSLAANGVVTFTTISLVPPAPKLAITRSGNTSSISFVSSNSATYKLYFTNSSGLGDFLTNWPSVGTNITGDGTTKTFTDSTTDSNRFYRVNAF